ncbi:hypothetical protein [Acetobacter sp. DsW_063]|uniref:hypothetical protein n=1 Tax=Acetobacter sp. DsW_063 TaxID=1514894 RepID=UPI000A3A7435|nr:hypothetical protein [Acetobacter sp. DsW_063]OUJ14381.1 hypothetical protein HK28_13805 [Acetobacter sp. DsW_063]
MIALSHLEGANCRVSEPVRGTLHDMSQTNTPPRSAPRAHMTLLSLQGYPEQFFSQADIHVTADAEVSGRATGGLYAATGSWDAEAGILTLALSSSGDPNGPSAYYYFPYVTAGSVGAEGALGIGYVDVPSDAPTGTLVITTGLTGCAVRVFRNVENTLRFYHDANGISVPKLGGYFGDLAFDAPYQANTDLKDVGAKGRYKEKKFSSPYSTGNGGQVASDRANVGGKPCFYSYSIVFVKEEKSWKAYASCVLRDNLRAFEAVPTFLRKLLGEFPVQAPAGRPRASTM